MRIVGGVFLLLLAVYGTHCVRRGWYEPPDLNLPSAEQRKRRNRGSDFTAYYSAGELARRGENLYAYERSSTPFRPFIYPPMFAVFPMAPLSLLSHNAALAVFFVLNLVLLCLACWLLRRLLWPESQTAPPPPIPPFWRRPEIGLFLAVLVCGRFLDANMASGNANVIIFFLLTLGLYALQKGRGLWSGVAVALATAYKLTPGLFGVYFLWSRRGWALLGGAAGLALFLWVVPSLVLGLGPNQRLLRGFAEYLKPLVGISAGAPAEAGSENGLEPKVVVGWAPAEKEKAGKLDMERAADGLKADQEEPPRAYGISLRGTFQKLLSKTVAFNRREAIEDKNVNLLNLEPATARRLADGVGFLLLLLCVVLTAPRAAQTGPFAPALAWGLVATTMLLVSPLTRKAHLVVLVLPVAVLIALLQQEALPQAAAPAEGRLGGGRGLAAWSRAAAWTALVLLGGVGLLTSPDLLGDRASESLHAAGCFTWSLLALYGALALALWSLRGGTGFPACAAQPGKAVPPLLKSTA